MIPRANKIATDKVHLRHCFLYEFQKANNATVACANLCGVFEENAVTARTCQRLFSRFKSGDLSVDDMPYMGCRFKVNNEVLQAMLEEELRLTSTVIGKILGVHHTTVLEHREHHSK